MQQYEYLLFDWDGTLAKTLDIWFDKLRESLKAHGHFIDDAEIGANYADFKQRFELQGFTELDPIINQAMAESNKAIPKVELYPDTLETLVQLHQASKKLALVTASEHHQIDPLLQKYSLIEVFDAVVCGDDTAQLKPHPEPLEKAMKLLGAQASETLMVGDSENDILAAKNAGIDSALFYPPSHQAFHNFDALKALEPNHIIANLREIIHLRAG